MRPAFRLIFLLIISSPIYAQIVAPQINLSGNIGCQGFPCLNNGTIQFTSDANRAMTVLETSATGGIKVTSTVSLTATRDLTLPTGNFQFIAIENATTGGQSIRIIGLSGTGVTIANGQAATVWFDGTNVVQTGSSGSVTFSTLTGGTNSTAAMIVGSGASLDYSGSGTNNASSISGIAITGTPATGQIPVATGPTAATWQNSAASFPPSQVNTYIVGEGDSRMANSSNSGPNSLPTQNFISQLVQQSNFSSVAGSVDLAVGGSTCALMTARYASGARNYRPGGSSVPGNVTKSMLILQIGVNDLRAGTAAVAEQSCMTSYIATAIADGFTVVPMTVYWFAGYTSAQVTQQEIYNNWIRSLPYSGQFPNPGLPFIFDYDLFFPPETSSPYYQAASTITAVTSVSVTSNVASLVTASQALAANNIVLLTGYSGASSCLNNQYLTVSATGLSSTTLQAPIGCPNLTATTGTLQLTGNDGLHMGPSGVKLAAQNFNAVYTVAQTGSAFTQPNFRDYYKPPSGYARVDGCFHAGGPGPSNCQSPGTLYSTLTSDPTQGLFIIGTSNLYVRGAAGWETTMVGGHYYITGATAPFSYQGGAMMATVTNVTLPTLAPGVLGSCTNIPCSTGVSQIGNQTISVDSTQFTLSAPMQLFPTAAATCSATIAGQFQYTQGNAITKDIVQVCAHDATNTYAWRTIY